MTQETPSLNYAKITNQQLIENLKFKDWIFILWTKKYRVEFIPSIDIRSLVSITDLNITNNKISLNLSWEILSQDLSKEPYVLSDEEMNLIITWIQGWKAITIPIKHNIAWFSVSVWKIQITEIENT